MKFRVNESLFDDDFGIINEDIDIDFTFDGDDESDYLGHATVDVDDEDIAIEKAKNYYKRNNPEIGARNFRVSNDHYTNADRITEDIDDSFDSLDENELADFLERKQSEEVLDGPQPGTDTTISNMLIDNINGEWDTIAKYNDMISALEQAGNEDLIPVIKDIIVEENKHIGQLQQCLKTISPNTEEIDNGEVEAEEQLSANTINTNISITDVDDEF